MAVTQRGQPRRRPARPRSVTAGASEAGCCRRVSVSEGSARAAPISPFDPKTRHYRDNIVVTAVPA
ncbi:hypothetical protein [Micromonospora purpureochromogenes]|uniref:hypothetical protein n=1 Tax=Micromonospora purpureochromogenes TaxID=47872 RepID=UPI003F4D0949